MQLSTQVSYAGGFKESAQQVAELERAGLDLVWVAEAYGFDGPSFMGYLAALTERVRIGSGILPLYTRTPTLLAMTAAGIDALSGGRAVLGLGASGPQVIEGWHGVPYDRPLARTREIVDICRKVWAREDRLTHEGPLYPLPLPEDQGTGLGKPLKIIGRPVRPRIPIYVASLGEKAAPRPRGPAAGGLPRSPPPAGAGGVPPPPRPGGAPRRSADLGPLDICAGGLACVAEPEEADKLLDAFSRPM